MKKISFILIIFIFLVSMTVSAGQIPLGVLTMVKGKVDVKNPGEEFKPGFEGMQLMDGFVIKTGEDGKTTILFRDGNIRFVRKNSTWSLQSINVVKETLNVRTKKVIAHIMKNSAAMIDYDTLTGITAPRDMAQSPPSPEKETKKSKALQFRKTTPSDSSPGKVLQVKKSRHPVTESLMDEPVIIQESDYNGISDKMNLEGAVTASEVSGIIPVPEGIMSVGHGGFLIPRDYDTQEVNIKISQNNVPVFDSKSNSLEFISNEAKNSLVQGKTYQLTVTWMDQNGNPVKKSLSRNFTTLSKKQEKNMNRLLSDLINLPSEIDQMTLMYLRAQIFIKFGILDLAMKDLLAVINKFPEKPLPHIRIELIRIYQSTGDKDLEKQQMEFFHK